MQRFKADNNVIGPMQLNSQIEQDNIISEELEALNVTGSKIVKNMLIVPIGNTVLYVNPIYQVFLNESDIPVLSKIIVASGNKVAIGNNLSEALDNLLSQNAVNIEVSSPDEKQDLINSIIRANLNLTESSNNNNWEMIGKDLKKLQDLINQLSEFVKAEELEELENTLNNENNIDNTIDENSVIETIAH